MPKVSFLIPVKNEGVNLKIILQILEATIDIPFEILVVVDSKEDDSIPVVCEIQKKYENIRLVQNTLGRGVAFAIRFFPFLLILELFMLVIILLPLL